jgi:hypothetical protein
MLCSTTPVATALDTLEDPNAETNESYFFGFGDDVLDVALGIDAYWKNRWIFDRPMLPTGVYDGDVVIVGSGPSLDVNLARLKSVQDSCLIVASHSAIPRLMAEGIIPHVICPKERLPDIQKIPEPLPDSVIYAGLPLVPHAPVMCKRQYLVGDCGKLSKWLGIYNGSIGVCPTSGTLAAWIGGRMSTGTIWLLGHDMTIGHYSGFKFREETTIGEIECVDGIKRPSTRIYRACQDNLRALATGCPVVQTAPRGAQIEGAEHGPFEPDIGPKPDLPYDETPVHRPCVSRMAAIPEIWPKALAGIERAKSHEDLTAGALFDPEHFELGCSLSQTIYLQVSILRRTLPLTDDQAFAMLKEAMSNTYRGLLPWARSIHGPT